MKSYKVELKLNNKQTSCFWRHSNAARAAFNWGLDLLIKDKESRENKLKPNHMFLSKLLNSIKKEQFPWMYEVSKCAPQSGLIFLDNAFKNFFRKYNDPKIKEKGFPNFKKKGRKEAFLLMSPQKMKVNDKSIKLPRIGKVLFKEHNYLPVGKYSQCHITMTADKWFVSINSKEDPIKPIETTGETLGVDLGIKTLATLSNGIKFDGSPKLKKKEKKLKRLQRQLARRRKGSRKRGKTKKRISRQWLKIGNHRKDILHKITSSIVKTKPSMIVIEDLNIKGMLKNHCLAKAISNMGFYEFRRQLKYKCEWSGIELVIADRFYPSSKICSNCRAIKDDLKLSDRTYNCSVCGFSIDRDINAAINLSHYESKLKPNTASSAEIYYASGDAKVTDHRIGERLGKRKQAVELCLT
jgi:putative transposase